MADLEREKPDSRPKRTDSRPERADLKSERADLKPERAYFGLKRGGIHALMNKQKSPCALQEFVLFGAAAQKEIAGRWAGAVV